MNSKLTLTEQDLLREIPEDTKSAISHILGNGIFIIQGLAAQLLDHEDDAVRTRMANIIRTIDHIEKEFLKPLHESKPAPDCGATREE